MDMGRGSSLCYSLPECRSGTSPTCKQKVRKELVPKTGTVGAAYLGTCRFHLDASATIQTRPLLHPEKVIRSNFASQLLRR